MKIFLSICAGAMLAAQSAFGVIVLSGTAASNLKQTNGTDSIVTGTLYMLVVDTTGNGFDAAANLGLFAGASTSAGSNLGGDYIAYSSTVGAVAGRAQIELTNFDQTAYAGKSFGIVWLESGSSSTLSAGQKYGFVTDATWVIPSANGNYGFTTTTITSINPFLQSTAPGGTNFSVAAVPEPSAAMLAVMSLGVALLRRRKRILNV